MAMALIAWLSAPAPMTWTSTLPICRTTPASAPATELGLDREDTFRTSMAVPSFGRTEWCVSSARYAGFLPKTPHRRTVCPNCCQGSYPDYLRSVPRQPLCVNLKAEITQGSHRALLHGNPKRKGPVAFATGPCVPTVRATKPQVAYCFSRVDVGVLRLRLGAGHVLRDCRTLPDAGLTHHLVGDLHHQFRAGAQELLGLLPPLT